MIDLAIGSNPYFHQSLIEVQRDRVAYTIDTITSLKKEYKEDELYFIIGGDSLFELESWKDSGRLIKACKFVVLDRGYRTKKDIDEKIIELKTLYKMEIEKIESPIIEISSTEIRNRIKDNLGIKYLVPEPLESYILNHKLYLQGDTNE